MGYFTIPAPKIVEEKGKAFALDISEDMLMEVKHRAVVEGVNNLEVIKVEDDIIPLEGNSCTFVFLAFVLHEIPETRNYLLNLINILQAGVCCIEKIALSEDFYGLICKRNL